MTAPATEPAYPQPRESPTNAPMLAAWREGALALQKCGACGHVFFYPRSVCPKCWDPGPSWIRSDGHQTTRYSSWGSLFSLLAWQTRFLRGSSGIRLVCSASVPNTDYPVPIDRICTAESQGLSRVSKLSAAINEHVVFGMPSPNRLLERCAFARLD